MRAADFDYHRPGSLGEAYRLLADPESLAIAGGQWLIPELVTRRIQPKAVVDLSGIDCLTGVALDDSEIRIGATVNATAIADLDSPSSPIDSIVMAVKGLGSRSVLNRATVGGNIAQGGPAMALTCLFSALGADVRIAESEVGCARLSITAYRRLPWPRPLILDVTVPLCVERRIDTVWFSPTVLGKPTAYGWIVGDSASRTMVLSGVAEAPIEIAVDPSGSPDRLRAALPDWIRPSVAATLRSLREDTKQGASS
jgi:CO/xanthine dehydrogenase FAD-binding subunit